MSDYKIHPRLLKDSIYLGKMQLSHILLSNNSFYKWFILVPQVEEENVYDLSLADRAQVNAEIQHVCQSLKDAFKPDKINTGITDNEISQLHIHIVGRFQDDPAWPNVVWGQSEVKKYDKAEFHYLIDKLRLILVGNIPEQYNIPLV